MQQKVLTIAIPTYNRAALLDNCLNSVLTQITVDLEECIELIVSDNASKDHTTEIVNKHRNKGYKINYTKNTENVGADRNIASCFLKAKGKYVWVFSDDDLILNGYLKLILDLLNKNDFGNIFLNNVWFTNEYKQSDKLPSALNCTKYNTPIEFVKRVSYWSTFISGNIINKAIFKNLDEIHTYYNTYLVQLSWTLPSIFSGNDNLVINDTVIACMAENTGGYGLIEIFGKNYNQILDRMIKEGIIDKQAKPIINHHLVNSFFPLFLNKENTKYNHTQENPMKLLFPIYWKSVAFWRKIYIPYVKSKMKKIVK